jgi:hypothetical protein
VIERFSTALSIRNDNLYTPKFQELNEECVALFTEIRKTGFLESDSSAASKLPQLSTTVSTADNLRMKKIAVYFPDRGVTEHGDARFLFLSVTNLENHTVVVRPAIRIRSMELDREVWIIEPTPKEFITVKWPDPLGSSSFKSFEFPFANALTSTGNENILNDLLLDPTQTKSFLVLFTLKGNNHIFTTVKKRAAYEHEMPCTFDFEVYYWITDVGQTEALTFRVNAQDWFFPANVQNIKRV